MKTDLKTVREYKTHHEIAPAWRKVVGYRVIFDGLEELEFFVHSLGEIRGEPKWRVSEKSTGYYCAGIPDSDTRQEAIKKTRLFLARKGRKKVLEGVKKELKRSEK